MPTFNLIDEPFIPCIGKDGRWAEYGLSDVILKAHEIVELRDDSPLVTIALHRLLLAILHRAYDGPKKVTNRLAILHARRFDADRVSAYLAKWADRFDLFHEKYPFYQLAGFKTQEPSGINRLAQELSRGNNAVLFDHTFDDPPPEMTPAKAARLLVAEQAFAVGGGKSDTGNTTHAPLVSGAVVLVRSDTLFETLWLNLTVYDDARPVVSDADDAPVWERKPSEPHQQPVNPFGYLDYLTWQSRTLRLVPEQENGRVVVRRTYYAQGRRCETDAGFFNPMMGYSRKDKKDAFQPVRFNEFRDLWRDSAPLYQIRDPDNALDRSPRLVHDLSLYELRTALPTSTRYKLSVFGLCTDKAKVNFWRHESLPLPLMYLDDEQLVGKLKLALKVAEEVTTDALRKAAWVTAAARLTGTGGMNPDTDRVRDLVDSFAPERLYWSRLELPYRELLIALAADDADRDAIVRDWFHDTLYRTALDAFDNSIGRLDAARDLKAVTTGRGVLMGLLRKVQNQNRIPDREPKEGAA